MRHPARNARGWTEDAEKRFGDLSGELHLEIGINRG
jgi:hypothetical protein